MRRGGEGGKEEEIKKEKIMEIRKVAKEWEI